ncbi:hypothetical protein DICPUDRAFT_77084 [Dictyostelium purpureum]|uniref:TolB-like 6-blade propeller-like n=1 Tax=Dictyostelium purpureum TaxID=5786 RepID=F0ZFJ6_DICPU|nr:uncharacterized protein DICPUDRAFT_77084 [Dictyostelium purpureum]EGC37306.1 hypothetical protein DICPUDRAFT_77084 [Dictyostelium purpureum]|eukprot:XP_003286194.1 hypothetical protein DICPUDRAFT_77084 [Dictyostelium purpureum]
MTCKLLFIFSLLFIFISFTNCSKNKTKIITPGPIDVSQFEDKPIAIAYGDGFDNGFELIEEGCTNLNKSVKGYIPLLVLSEHKYLGSRINSNSASLAIISKKGVEELYVQTNLKKFNYIIDSSISYDDSLNYFIFTSFGELNIYNISSDSYKSVQIFSSLFKFQGSYYDITSNDYFAFGTLPGPKGASSQHFLYADILNEDDYNTFSLGFEIYEPVISGYEGNFIVFAANQTNSNNKQLFSMDSKGNNIEILAIRDNGFQLVRGLNPRYIALTNPSLQIIELFDLKKVTSKIYTTYCSIDDPTINFSLLTSIIPKLEY